MAKLIRYPPTPLHIVKHGLEPRNDFLCHKLLGKLTARRENWVPPHPVLVNFPTFPFFLKVMPPFIVFLERKHHEVALGQNAFQFFVNFPIPLMKLSVLGKICQTFPKLEQHKSKASRENEFIKRKYLNWGKRTARRGKTKLV